MAQDGQNYYSGCMVYGVGVGCWCRFPTAVRIRLSQPPAGDWLAGAWAELDNICGLTVLLMK